ncbi:hypothetical protein Vafri_11958 [Volvox africanus]|uniref:SAP domain-containing protein n=1 Tax=Volvox africanus TaxID=51714 RepID=A0A8J4BA16_9CHLO|nr:hypothetical protein Vafri_11958 [Volvox africanus]
MHHSVPAFRAASPSTASLGLHCIYYCPVVPATWVAEAAASESRPRRCSTAARPPAHHVEAVAAAAATSGPLFLTALRTSSDLVPWRPPDATAAGLTLPWCHTVCTRAILSNRQLTSGSNDAVAPRLPVVMGLMVPSASQLPDLASLKVSELQSALRSLGLPISGRKADLIERLVAAQRPAATASPSAVQLAEDESDSAQRPVVSAARRRARSRTAVVDDGVEEARTSEDGVAATATEVNSAGGGAVRRRRAVTQRGQGGEARSVGAGDLLLDELFSTMDLNISVETRGPREVQVAGSTPTTTSASARMMGGGEANGSGDAVAVGVGKGEQRRRRVSSLVATGMPATAAPREETALSGVRTDRGTSSTTAATTTAAAAAGKGVRNDQAEEADKSTAARLSQSSAPSYAPGFAATSTSRDDADLGQDSEHDYDLPPWPPMFMGEMRSIEDLAPGNRDAQEELLLGNVSGMSMTVLGSAAVRPTANRALGSLAMARVKDIFIFDAGDDTQRQVAHAYHVKPSKIYRIFLTSLEPESVLGLPGLMCIINSSRERGHEIADIPVHVYGPPGTADFLGAMMRISHTCLEVTIVVHEISTGPVAPAESQPYLYVKRARIWRVLMPPDQLNPRGGVDASLLLFAPDQGRSQKKRGRNSSGGVLSFDPRAGFLPFPPLEPGNPYK